MKRSTMKRYAGGIAAAVIYALMWGWNAISPKGHTLSETIARWWNHPIGRWLVATFATVNAVHIVRLARYLRGQDQPLDWMSTHPEQVECFRAIAGIEQERRR